MENEAIFALVLGVVGTLLALAGIIIKRTPTQVDDAWWAKFKNYPILGGVIGWLEDHSWIKQKEDPPTEPPSES